jgi:hypothetical protein
VCERRGLNVGAGDSGAAQATPGIVPGSSSGGAGGRPPNTWQPKLNDVFGCMKELSDCSRGLAYLDHHYAQTLDALDVAEATWNTVEAEAAEKARTDAPKAATAVEIRGLITSYVDRHQSKREDRERVQAERRELAKIERWMRTLEKRMSAAQSALNGHDQLGRYGGGA